MHSFLTKVLDLYVPQVRVNKLKKKHTHTIKLELLYLRQHKSSHCLLFFFMLIVKPEVNLCSGLVLVINARWGRGEGGFVCEHSRDLFPWRDRSRGVLSPLTLRCVKIGISEFHCNLERLLRSVFHRSIVMRLLIICTVHLAMKVSCR